MGRRKGLIVRSACDHSIPLRPFYYQLMPKPTGEQQQQHFAVSYGEGQIGISAPGEKFTVKNREVPELVDPVDIDIRDQSIGCCVCCSSCCDFGDSFPLAKAGIAERVSSLNEAGNHLLYSAFASPFGPVIVPGFECHSLPQGHLPPSAPYGKARKHHGRDGTGSRKCLQKTTIPSHSTNRPLPCLCASHHFCPPAGPTQHRRKCLVCHSLGPSSAEYHRNGL